MLAHHADEPGYQYIDLHSVFADAKGALKLDLSNDGIHLLAPGYRLWRSEIIGKQIDGFDNVAVRITMTLLLATQEPS